MGSYPPVPKAPYGPMDPLPDFSAKRKGRMQKKGVAPPPIPQVPQRNGKKKGQPDQVPFIMPPHSKAT